MRPSLLYATAWAALIATGLACSGAQAAPYTIVALGASNTAGKGVSSEQAYPAQLQALLRSKGHDVTVRNAGVSGETTADMLARLAGAVPSGTDLVLLQPGGNDFRKGQRGDRAANIGAIVSAIRARGISVVVFDHFLDGIAKTYYQPDGEHLTPAGYALIARRMLPQVEAAMARRQGAGGR